MVSNSRPITYISAGDLEEPLASSILLTGRRIVNYPDYSVSSCKDDYKVVAQQLSYHYNLQNKFLDIFWDRFSGEMNIQGSFMRHTDNTRVKELFHH